jgi:hypothetical protein
MARRVFLLLSALMLVGAFALASAGVRPPELSTALGWIDARLPAWIGGLGSSWISQQLILPLLNRPAWLLPGSLGLIFGAAAVTLPAPPDDSRKRAN